RQGRPRGSDPPGDTQALHTRRTGDVWLATAPGAPARAPRTAWSRTPAIPRGIRPVVAASGVWIGVAGDGALVDSDPGGVRRGAGHIGGRPPGSGAAPR